MNERVVIIEQHIKQIRNEIIQIKAHINLVTHKQKTPSKKETTNNERNPPTTNQICTIM